MQFGVKAANYPIPEDFERNKMPGASPYRAKLSTILPETNETELLLRFARKLPLAKSTPPSD